MSSIKLAAIVFSLMAVTVTVWASEPDELRDKAKGLHQEAAELAEQGHKQEAENLKRKAVAMLEEAERLEHHGPDQQKTEITRLKRILVKLHQQQRDHEATRSDSAGSWTIAWRSE